MNKAIGSLNPETRPRKDPGVNYTAAHVLAWDGWVDGWTSGSGKVVLAAE